MSETPPEPRLAATVVMLRNGPSALEVLLLQRSSRLPDRPGSWVFPGGRVDDADFGSDDAPLDETVRRTAVRETHEEAGLHLEPSALTPISRWITPEASNFRRYDTYFFATAVDPETRVTVDGGEISTHRWLTPDDALVAHRGGDIQLPPPTFVTIHWLTAFPDAGGALSGLASLPRYVFRPRICPRDDGACILYPGDAGYEIGEPETTGPRHRLWSSPEGYRYERVDC